MVTLELRPVPVAAPWHSYLFPAPFPIAPALAAPLGSFLEQLTLALELDFSLHREVFVHSWKLHTEGTSAIFHAHLSTWLPVMGLGVWPDREPPSVFTQERFMDASAAGIEGNEPDLPAYRLLQLDAAVTVRRSAALALFGRSALTQIFSGDAFPELERRTREVFLPSIQAPIYTHERFYMPLLDVRGLGTARGAEDIDRWLGGARAYLRESAEDGGILLLSALPLEELLQRTAEASGVALSVTV